LLLSQNVYCVLNVRLSLWLLITPLVSSSFLGRRSGDRMIVGFTTTCAISAYHH